jgi:hypothetical protein
VKFLGHLLAVALATVAALSISSLILGHTLWSSQYLERKATTTNLYSNLAAQLPLVASAAGAPPVPGLSPSAGLLQSQFSALIPQLITYFHSSGPAPTVDQGAFATAIGRPPPDGSTTTPLSLGSAGSNLTSLTRLLSTASALAPYAAAALVALILLVMGHRRLPTLARAAWITTVTLGVSGALFWLLPYVLFGALAKPTLTPIRTAIWPFVTGVTRDIAFAYLAAAALTLIAWVALVVAGSLAHMIGRLSPRPKTPAPPLPPAPGANRFS